MGLISIDTSGPTAVDVPPYAQLGDAPGLQALHEPTPHLDLSPRHILQQDPPRPWHRRVSERAVSIAAALMVHGGFALALFLLLSFREPAPTREVEIPVDFVVEKPEGPKTSTPQASGATSPAMPKSEPAKAPDPIQQALQQALAPPPIAPDPKPPAPPSVQPLPPPTPPTPPQDRGEAPKLVAPPPAPSAAATQDHEAKPANVAPDIDKVDQATHEARPADIPQTLTTADPKAGFAVPPPAPAKPIPEEKPTPNIPAKVQSETDKLAAALPMDTSAMPSSFRAVLAGGNGAQVSAVYKGLVYGRFNRNPEVGERARRQHLKGQVIVAFSIDDTGKIKELSVLQSSGNAAVDALGLELIRSAAPFPPPPPDAQRSFTPALSFGE